MAAALPGAYREQGPPGVRELAQHVGRISDRHAHLVATADVLASSPRADSTRRATARALADASSEVGRAMSSISRAVAMSARLHEVADLSSPRAEAVRERAERELNLALSHTRLALTDASEALRHQARSGRSSATLPPVRSRAALARTAGTPAPTSLTAPPASSAAAPAPAAAHGR
ncbi:hypothetical protein ACIRRH_33530 [Kitasatospora sp. NPDC101235]|uniref:hypothetical protein n=1 Tax=Kitasatospora sp. NPDC101235 TaxID=3364101 RepID=UPI0038258CC1